LLRRPKQYLSLKQLALIIIFFIGLLMLIYSLSYISLIKERSVLTQLYVTEDDLNAQIATIEKNKTTMLVKNATVETKLPQFSPYLKGLIEAVPEGVWLTNIKLSNVDLDLDLSGYATHFEIIPHFFKNLSKLSTFPKGKISILNLARVDTGEQAGAISFKFGRISGN
jgi:Tfp pilus assembly protein PilN